MKIIPRRLSPRRKYEQATKAICDKRRRQADAINAIFYEAGTGNVEAVKAAWLFNRVLAGLAAKWDAAQACIDRDNECAKVTTETGGV